MKLQDISNLSAIVVITCCIKLLLDGVVVDIFGHVLNFGHVDPVTYISILTPILGAHGFIRVSENKNGDTK